MKKQKVLAIVFDLDNTLVSSSLDFTLIKSVIGCPKNCDILTFIARLNSSMQKQAINTVHQFELEDALQATKMPGTDDIVSLLQRLNMPCAIVTRNNNKASKIKTQHIDIPLVLTRDQFKAKPAPDAVNYLSSKWNIDTKNILCVGDYIYDIEIAQNAGAQSCLINYGLNLDYAKRADYTVKDLHQLIDILNKQTKT